MQSHDEYKAMMASGGLADGLPRPPDKDVAWALQHLERDADILSEINGPKDGATLEARRLETTFKRVARQAGYDTI